jgi:hypothetical protein
VMAEAAALDQLGKRYASTILRPACCLRCNGIRQPISSRCRLFWTKWPGSGTLPQAVKTLGISPAASTGSRMPRWQRPSCAISTRTFPCS